MTQATSLHFLYILEGEQNVGTVELKDLLLDLPHNHRIRVENLNEKIRFHEAPTGLYQVIEGPDDYITVSANKPHYQRQYTLRAIQWVESK